MEKTTLISAALLPVAIWGWIYLMRKIEMRIRAMPPSPWRRVLLLGRK